MSFKIFTAAQASELSDTRNDEDYVRTRVGKEIHHAADGGRKHVCMEFATQIGWLINELKAANYTVTYANAAPTRQQLKIEWS
jgi:hypothetical protein